MVLESVSCTEEDLLFTDAETGTDADAETFALEQLSTVLLSLHKCSMSFRKENQTKNVKKNTCIYNATDSQMWYRKKSTKI